MTIHDLYKDIETQTRLMAYDRGLKLRKLAKNTRAYRKGYRWQITGEGNLQGSVNMVAPSLRSARTLMLSFPFTSDDLNRIPF